jgi:hypothetical protein
MRQIESILSYSGMLLILIYLFYRLDWELYLLTAIGISSFIFSLRNYNKLKKEIKLHTPLSIPKRSESVIYTVLSLVIGIGFIGLLYYLNYKAIINIPDLTFPEKLILGFAFPVLGLVTYFKFSDVADRYIITNNNIFNGVRYRDCLTLEKIHTFTVDNDKANINLMRSNKILMKMKIEKKYFNDNIDKIIDELKLRINRA